MNQYHYGDDVHLNDLLNEFNKKANTAENLGSSGN
jgi:hypothetical protein